MAARGRMPGEFVAIARYFAPLATHPGAFGLKDDLAWLKPSARRRIVLKTDAIVVGVHTLPGDPPDLIARKALRVNLSDLAGKGARPLGYMLALVLPEDTKEAWLARFAAGLAADQKIFGLPLLGGDLTRTPGPATISITAIGEARPGRPLLRAGARRGDAVFVSGTIGDAALGLLALKGKLPGLPAQHWRYLAARYHLPAPRLTLGREIARLATAAMDISDGLVADLGHICEASNRGAEIDLAAVPASPAAKAAGDRHALLRITGGDDYELLFTAPAKAEPRLRAIARRSGVPITRVGHIVARPGVRVLAPDGSVVPVRVGGWEHF
ncbi:MAG TPA: thiamine-phosphate kinase [Alphaproteobacteria bacterium]|jgi:thiamine-monophosphate kinase